MEKVCSGIWREIVVGHTAADVDGNGSVGYAIVERRSVGIAVEVDRVLLKQVRTHDHADVGQRKEEFIVFVNGHHRGWDVAVHDADVHDLTRIDVASKTTGRRVGARAQTEAGARVDLPIRVWNNAYSPVGRCRARRGCRIEGRHKDRPLLCPREAAGEVIQAGEGPERE